MDDLPFYMDGYLRSNLDIAKAKIKEDWDFMFVVDGVEGSGKSTLGAQVAWYCFPGITLDQYAFSPGQFKKIVRDGKPTSAVVYDEAHSGLNSRATMSMVNRALVSMMTEMRQKNLFVLIILPTFFDLDKYPALFRSKMLLHTYTTKTWDRRLFAAYVGRNKKMLYLLGKKLYEYGKPRPDFHGRFPDWMPFDTKEYRKRKAKAMQGREAASENTEINKLADEIYFERVMRIPDNLLSHRQRYTVLGMPEGSYWRKLREWREMNQDALSPDGGVVQPASPEPKPQTKSELDSAIM